MEGKSRKMTELSRDNDERSRVVPGSHFTLCSHLTLFAYLSVSIYFSLGSSSTLLDADAASASAPAAASFFSPWHHRRGTALARFRRDHGYHIRIRQSHWMQ